MRWNSKIKEFWVTGDIHGVIDPVIEFFENHNPESEALIILGDAGFNFYLNKTDRKKKEKVQSLGGLVYCVRGNHEERPENIEGMEEIWDNTVQGYIYYEPHFPNIRYFQDGEIYTLTGYRTLVIGGAYSVDKKYRLDRARAAGIDPETHWTGWFKDELLTPIEMESIEAHIRCEGVDFVLTHTCPYTWQPFDLFLSMVNQNEVDKSMEKWFDDLRFKIRIKRAWLFGHFHDDRLVRPHVEMYYKKFDSLSHIAQRWEDWDNGYKVPWYLQKDPNWFYWQEEQDKRKLKYDPPGDYLL